MGCNHCRWHSGVKQSENQEYMPITCLLKYPTKWKLSLLFSAAAASESTGRQMWKRLSLDQSVHQLPASHTSMSLALPPNVMWTRISTTTCQLFLILSFVGNVQLKAELPHRIYGCMLTTRNINKYREFSFHSGLLHSNQWRCPFCSGKTRRIPRYKNNLCSCTFGSKVTSAHVSLYLTTTNTRWWW
jgi:hypothetical protein